jgi:hypothetical protein
VQLVADLTARNDGRRRVSRTARIISTRPAPGPRRYGRFAGEDLAGGRFGIDRIGLAGVAAQLAVGPIDLDHHHTTLTQPTAHPRAVRAGALYPHRADGAKLARPRVQLREPSRGGRDLEFIEPAAELIERDRNMGVLVARAALGAAARTVADPTIAVRNASRYYRER